jgi:hypothetical protein
VHQPKTLTPTNPLSFGDVELHHLLLACEPLPIDLRGRLLADLARIARARVSLHDLIARLALHYRALAEARPIEGDDCERHRGDDAA